MGKRVEEALYSLASNLEVELIKSQEESNGLQKENKELSEVYTNITGLYRKQSEEVLYLNKKIDELKKENDNLSRGYDYLEDKVFELSEKNDYLELELSSVKIELDKTKEELAFATTDFDFMPDDDEDNIDLTLALGNYNNLLIENEELNKEISELSLTVCNLSDEIKQLKRQCESHTHPLFSEYAYIPQYTEGMLNGNYITNEELKEIAKKMKEKVKEND